MNTLWTPWRMEHVLGRAPRVAGCLFEPPGAAPFDRDHLLLLRDELCVVLLNRFPYANGHLLLAPRRHVADPIWTGSIWSAEDARGDRERRFVLDGRDCAVREFGSADDTAIEERGAGSVTAPVPGSFLGFGAGWTDRAAMSTPALKTFWYTHGSDERLWSEAAGVLGTYNSRARAAGARIPPNGTCSVAGITLPCWDYPVQRPGDDIGWDGCFPNDEASRCDHWYSHYDCTTAFWRVEDRAEHVLALESGYSSPRGIRLGNEFYLWCHDDIANSTYRTPACCRDQLILRPARASGSFDEFHTIDHEFGHHLTNGLLGTIPARGDGCCYRHDLGQSQSIGEVLADFFPDIWSGQLPGTLHSSLQMMGGGWDGRPTGGLYPTYDLERTDCRPFPVLIPLACTTNANCAPKSYCWDGVCRTRCLYVGPSFVDDDSHNFHGEPGDHDPHGPANGRVLAQALADWHERFGSSAFQPALPFAYDDGDGRHATMFSADVLQPDGTKIPVARDWGVSHSLENNSSGVFECNEGGMYTLIRQRIIIREPYVGQMLVSFGRIRLPTDAEMRIRTDRDEGYAVVGPLDFDPVEDGWLFSSFLPGQEIRVEVDGRLSGPIASRRCSNGPPVFVRAWRHIEGDQAERIVLRAMQRSHHTDDWYDFYEAIMVADRELHGPVMQHQGEFFRIGFEGHGIDRRLGEFCSHHPYGCHAGPR